MAPNSGAAAAFFVASRSVTSRPLRVTLRRRCDTRKHRHNACRNMLTCRDTRVTQYEMPFVKLDCEFVNSSTYMDRDARDVFVTALLLAVPHELREEAEALHINTGDPTGWIVPAGWYGFVRAAGVALVHRACCDQLEGLAALWRLGEPEGSSKSRKHDGRRMVRIDGGFIVLNYMSFRDRDHTSADRSRRWRLRNKTPNDTPSPPVSTRDGTQAEAEAEAEKEKEKEKSVAGAPLSSPAKGRTTRNPQPDAYSAAQLLYDAIRSHTPGFMADAKRVAVGCKLTSWARDIDVGMRNDGMTLDGCREAINAAHRSEDPFWRSNILSGKKLRQHYEKLRINASGRKSSSVVHRDADFRENQGDM